MSVRIAVAESESDWLAALVAGDQPSGFHAWEWLEIHSRVYGWRFLPLVVQHHGRPIGVFPVFRRGARTVRAPAASFPYLGPTVPVERLTETMRAFRRWQLCHALLDVHFSVRHRPGGAAAAAMRAAGAQLDVAHTYAVQLEGRSEDEVTQGFSRQAKRNIRKAEAAGVTVRRSTREEIRTVLPAVLADAFRRHGSQEPYGRAGGALLADYALSRDHYAATAFIDDRPAGLILGVESGGIALHALGGSLTQYREHHVDSALTLHHLRWALEREYHTLDMAGHVDEGVRRFKLSFGAEEERYIAARSVVAGRTLRVAGAAMGLVRHGTPQQNT